VAKRITVFYSWQSDTPSKANRNFIEDALNEALKQLHSDAELEVALRDTEIELDKDTKGVPGSPPIVETILRKIEECTVFVADVTFVAESLAGLPNKTGKPRLVPNPNVLIEYGYALRCHKHTGVVAVMNTAYGVPTAETLPFDLRHLRWPMTYHVSSESNSEERKSELKKLVAALIDALRLVLVQHQPSKDPQPSFVPQKSTTSAALFHEKIDDLLPQDRWAPVPGSVILPEGAKMYLRVYPIQAVQPFETEQDALEALKKGRLQPCGDTTGHGVGRNTFGAIAYGAPIDGKLFHFTQLFLSREIWCVDALELNADMRRKWFTSANLTETAELIPLGSFEKHFVDMLQTIDEANNLSLRLPFPLKVEAGLCGIKGYSAITEEAWATRGGQTGQKAMRDVSWECQIDEFKPAWEILNPFFDKVWKSCGVNRTAQHQEKLFRAMERRLDR
jgi:hypothetical protein